MNYSQSKTQPGCTLKLEVLCVHLPTTVGSRQYSISKSLFLLIFDNVSAREKDISRPIRHIREQLSELKTSFIALIVSTNPGPLVIAHIFITIHHNFVIHVDQHHRVNPQHNKTLFPRFSTLSVHNCHERSKPFSHQ